MEVRDGAQGSGARATGGYEHVCGCWKLNPMCVRAASTPTAEPALQALRAFCLFVVKQSCCVLQAGLELAVLPPLPVQFWDYWHAPLYLAS